MLKVACEGKLVPTEAELAHAEGRAYEPADVLLAHILKERREKSKGAKYKEPAAPDTGGLPALPEGWLWTRLGDICETTSGGTPSRKNKNYFGGSIPWLKSGELKNGIIKSAEESITEEALENSSAKIIPNGTLLIALYGATVGKLGILGIDAAINQAICAIFTPNDINQKYLFWYLSIYRNELLNVRIGAAQPNISQQIVNDVPLPLPPLAEQRRIVAEVERRLSVADEVARTVEQSLAQAQRLRQSILKKAFEGKLVAQDARDEPAGVLLEKIRLQKQIKKGRSKR